MVKTWKFDGCIFLARSVHFARKCARRCRRGASPVYAPNSAIKAAGILMPSASARLRAVNRR